MIPHFPVHVFSVDVGVRVSAPLLLLQLLKAFFRSLEALGVGLPILVMMNYSFVLQFLTSHSFTSFSLCLFPVSTFPYYSCFVLPHFISLSFLSSRTVLYSFHICNNHSYVCVWLKNSPKCVALKQYIGLLTVLSVLGLSVDVWDICQPAS